MSFLHLPLLSILLICNFTDSCNFFLHKGLENLKYPLHNRAMVNLKIAVSKFGIEGKHRVVRLALKQI